MFAADALAHQPRLFAAEFIDNRAVDNAGHMARPGFQQHGLFGPQNQILIALLNGPAFHRFLGEQIGRAQQNAHARATCRQTGRQRSHHRR